MSRAELTSDAMLLDRFASGRDEAAFLELVQRHGPMVRKTCRRFLACEHEADDVFQATFLLLADKAGTIAWQESVSAWLNASAGDWRCMPAPRSRGVGCASGRWQLWLVARLAAMPGFWPRIVL